MSNTYIYQKFLALTNTKDFNMETYRVSRKIINFIPDYTVSKELFDKTGALKRTARLSELDTTINTESDLRNFCNKLKDIDTLVLIDDRPNCSNLIYNAYSEEITKAYIIWLKKYVEKVYICKT